ncbi:unnamed protein product [Schistosoma bovis]|nr:unnamed protein product [Schistosoma bovis]CAH8602717.1 unnamed protein product [Schistosoma bovis]
MHLTLNIINSSGLQTMFSYDEFKDKCRESMETGDFEWMEVVPYDSRFPNTNQTPKCVQNFVDFQRCKRVYGEEYKACNYFMRTAQLLCPSSWIEKWEKEVENNMFPYKI